MMSGYDEGILMSQRVVIVRRLKVTPTLLACLRTDYADDMQKKVEAEKTESKKAETLLDFLMKRGVPGYYQFIQALVESDQDKLALVLDKNAAQQYISERDSKRPAGAKEGELEKIIDEINGEHAPKHMKFTIQPATELHHAQSPMVYAMRSIPRGRAVIINNRNFDSRKLDRIGAEYDSVNLKELFEQLCFTVIIHENLSAEQIKDLLQKESQHPDHKRADMFVLFLLSHGSQGLLLGIDGESVSIETDVTAPFNTTNSPKLAGKPKLFFIQACQGSGVTVFSTDSEEEEMDENLQFEKIELEDKEGFVPQIYHKESDVVLSYATIKGYASWRRPDSGTWFVRCLVSVFSRRAHYKHLMDMLTETNYLLSKLKTAKTENGICTQLAEKRDTLNKHLYFFPGASARAKKLR